MVEVRVLSGIKYRDFKLFNPANRNFLEKLRIFRKIFGILEFCTKNIYQMMQRLPNHHFDFHKTLKFTMFNEASLNSLALGFQLGRPWFVRTCIYNSLFYQACMASSQLKVIKAVYQLSNQALILQTRRTDGDYTGQAEQ